MKNPSDPTNSTQKDAVKHAEYVVDLAKKLADGTRPGVFATVDEQGMPHLRWMATLSLREFPRLYTITSPESRKIQHIRSNPNVELDVFQSGNERDHQYSGKSPDRR